MSSSPSADLGATMPFEVATFYRFEKVPAPQDLCGQVADLCGALPAAAELCGTVLVAGEGINVTLAARSGSGLGDLVARLTALLGAPPRVKWSAASAPPFGRLRVRVKQEIVTLRAGEARPAQETAREVGAAEWRELVARDDVLLVDVRNDYEIESGCFAGAVDPHTDSFTEFVDWIDRELEGDEQRPIAMYCTGGIRCEKISSLMLRRGFDNVTQLRGGILGYFEEVRDADLPGGSAEPWRGECFVFDDRTTLTPKLTPGGSVMCSRCGWPVTPAQQQRPEFLAGLGCVHCRGEEERAGTAPAAAGHGA